MTIICEKYARWATFNDPMTQSRQARRSYRSSLGDQRQFVCENNFGDRFLPSIASKSRAVYQGNQNFCYDSKNQILTNSNAWVLAKQRIDYISRLHPACSLRFGSFTCQRRKKQREKLGDNVHHGLVYKMHMPRQPFRETGCYWVLAPSLTRERCKSQKIIPWLMLYI